MSQTRNTGFLTNIIQYTPSGNISFVSGSTTLMSISSSGAITTTGVISGSNALSSSFAISSSFATFATTATTAATASSVSNLNQNVVVTGSLTTTGQIVAQTLNVQQVTSSIVFSSGSNIFGSSVGNTQQMTGSVLVTGSLSVVTTGTELQVGATGVTLGNALTDVHNVTGSLRVTGSVGIGTTPSAWVNPFTVIQGGTWGQHLAFQSNTADVKLGTNNYYNGTNYLYFTSSQGAAQFNVAGASGFQFNVAPTGTTGATVNFTSSMVITNAGNVGIGTTSPSTLMHVNTARSSGANVDIMTLSDNVTGIQTSGFGVRILATSNNGQAKSAIAFEADGGTNNDTAIAFYTQTSAASLDRRMTINKASVTLSGPISIGNTITVGNQGGVDTTVITGGSGYGSKVQWNSSGGVACQITGNTDSYVNLFTGNFGIGKSSPAYKLDVAGDINIPGGNRIIFNSEPNVWGITARTNTSTTNLGAALKNIIYCGGGANEGFAVLGSGYTAAFEVNNNGSAWVKGTLTKGGGSFRIDHPLLEKKDTHFLYHSFIEGPKADLIYRGKINLVNGAASVNIDEVSTMTEGTFELLTRDAQCFVNNLSGWDLVRGNIAGNTLTIISQNTESTDEISWMVVAERNDEWFRESEMTDDEGNTIVEKLKPIIE